MKRYLIVNADDCNLTPGVTRAILDCHDRGILTSTTFMINLPVAEQTVREILKRKSLGVGIHLNVTLGKPVSEPGKVSSLLDGSTFKKLKEQQSILPREKDLETEYQNQINLFRIIFGRKPTHLDTHHQVHDLPFFYEVLRKVALQNNVPMRRSVLMRQATTRKGVRTTPFFLGNLTAEGYWREEALTNVLSNLPEAVSEIMCHPGKIDRDLKQISSFTTGREVEYRLFSSPAFRSLAARQGVTLTHFGVL